ncbi:spermidine synthase [Aquisphaera giovannonii]|uniref:Spermidine synthase n=1 Tax=Aquisphaera giovannonii TaxID=406548 RepID=A0A5B9VZU3_9BACT|nr:fused MFS/spermidine synthase [Aquisphaera giovannonii]QEH33892.1 spermidine synthase [Aquisphaera giovannonii]
MAGVLARLLPYALAFLSSLCIMILELVSSRLVARHVGSSLTVWTSVIGIILGGICLGNVLGGRLADRVEPRRAVGPLFALGAMLTLACLWMNAVVDRVIPSPESMNWELRTVLVVVLDFLVPATVLGMVGPVVAKMAVEQSRRSGSAIGDVYVCGAIGSIVGTFLAGFILMYLASSSTIVLVVGAALSLLSALLASGGAGAALGLVASALLGLGSVGPVVRGLGLGSIHLGSYDLNYLAVAGNVAALAMGINGLMGLLAARQGSLGSSVEEGWEADSDATGVRPSLKDLATLAFVASLAFMALEMVAGRLVARHLGSSIYGWTSVIAVLLAGLSLGNYLGGRIANLVRDEKQASWLFLAASVMTLGILAMEAPASLVQWLFDLPEHKNVLGSAIAWNELKLPFLPAVKLSWQYRLLLVTAIVFFVPAITMGTVSPVVAKLAVDRLRRFKRTGTAIGEVYAWGMVGSILGTFLTGFYLIDLLGTKGVLLVIATLMAFAATVLGTLRHALWAGVPLGCCVLAFLPIPVFHQIGENYGLREPSGDPATKDDAFAWVDESKYYYIKVTNDPEDGPDGEEVNLRTLVLDNLIHGYFVLGHPERLDYDYEHVYAQVAYRAAKAGGRITLAADSAPAGKPSTPGKVSDLPANVFSQAGPSGKREDRVKERVRESLQALDDQGRRAPILPKVARSDLKTLFLGGGAYTFQRHMQYAYPGTQVDVAEIDPAVSRANFMATGLPADTPIQTHWGDARQFVEKNAGQKQYDLIFGDAFNDFSVPWHLTTREFNDKIAGMLSPTGVYMINIIDVYESDDVANMKADRRISKDEVVDPAARERIHAQELDRARRYGGFLGAWTKTAQLSFPHLYIFGTDRKPGAGLRETFVVVASKQPLDLEELGRRPDDPQFFRKGRRTEPMVYDAETTRIVIEDRSRGIILTDDYAPVENLLAPVAETRGDD